MYIVFSSRKFATIQRSLTVQKEDRAPLGFLFGKYAISTVAFTWIGLSYHLCFTTKSRSQ